MCVNVGVDSNEGQEHEAVKLSDEGEQREEDGGGGGGGGGMAPENIVAWRLYRSSRLQRPASDLARWVRKWQETAEVPVAPLSVRGSCSRVNVLSMARSSRSGRTEPEGHEGATEWNDEASRAGVQAVLPFRCNTFVHSQSRS